MKAELEAKAVLPALVVAGLLAAAGLAGPAAWAADSPGRDHGHSAAAQVLKLNEGRKWASDEPLRQSMAKIREAVHGVMPEVHRGQLKASQYDALGAEIDRQVANIVQNCKLDPQADEVLHVILAELIAGNEVLRGRDAKAKRADGVVGVAHALEQYGEHFEHEGWKPPKLDH